MPGIFDIIYGNAIRNRLSQIMGGETPEQQMRNADPEFGSSLRPMTTEQIQAAQRLTGAPVTAPPPMIVQAMNNGGAPVAPAPAVAPPIANAMNAPMEQQDGVPTVTTQPSRPLPSLSELSPQASDDDTPTWVKVLEAAGRGLSIAGSPDPVKTFATFRDMDSGSKPKVTPLADGAFSMITYPNGRTQIVRNDQVAQYLGQQQQEKFQQALQKVILGGQVQAGTAADKAAIKSGEESRPVLNDVNSLIDRWSQAYNIVAPVKTDEKGNPIMDDKGNPVRGSQGTMAQVQGMFPTIAGFFGGDQVAANKFLEGLTVDETLLNTARTKGAISNQEMNLFKAPIPSLTDDREKVWKPWIEKRVEVLNKLKNFYEGEIQRGAAAGSGGSSAAPSAPAKPSGGMTVPGLSPNASKYFK